MGFLDEFKRLAHPYEDEEEDNFEDDFDASPRPIERRERERAPRSEPAYSSPVMDELEARRSNKVVNIHTTTQLQVVLGPSPSASRTPARSPTTCGRSARWCSTWSPPTRISPAACWIFPLPGVAYANEGKIKKVAISTYIITPYNVDILGDLIDELENNGLYF